MAVSAEGQPGLHAARERVMVKHADHHIPLLLVRVITKGTAWQGTLPPQGTPPTTSKCW